MKLWDLLAVNQNGLVMYLLKDDLKHLWSYRSPHHARTFWEFWKQRASESGLEQLKTFARRLDAFIEGIIARAQFPLKNTGGFFRNGRMNVTFPLPTPGYALRQ